MLSAPYAQKITVRPLRAIGLGRKFSHAMSKAQELAPNNPRVVLLKTITDYNLPRIVGGNRRRAVEGLHRAAASSWKKWWKIPSCHLGDTNTPVHDWELRLWTKAIWKDPESRSSAHLKSILNLGG